MLMFHLNTLHTGIVFVPVVHGRIWKASTIHTLRLFECIHLQTKYAGDNEEYFSWKLNLQKLKEKKTIERLGNNGSEKRTSAFFYAQPRRAHNEI